MSQSAATHPNDSADPTAESMVDRALDRSVVLGYSRLGYVLRSRSWAPLPPGVLTGKEVLLTGGTAGIGLAAARQLAELGASVHVVGHRRDRADQAAAKLEAAVPGAAFCPHVRDIGDLDDVRALAEELRDEVGSLHALLHNAGTMSAKRRESAQGHELTLATQVLGPFLLTRELAATMGADGRVVFMSSGGMYAKPVVLDDLEFRHGYSGTVAYARTKRMLVDLTPRWQETLPDAVTAHSMHPGWVDTPGVRTYLPTFRRLTGPSMRTADQGADTLVWLAAARPPATLGGNFWHDRAIRPVAYAGRPATSAADRDRLWDYCERAVTGA